MLRGIWSNFGKKSFKELILIIAIVLSLIVIIFPPFKSSFGYEAHSFFLSKPAYCYSCTISIQYLGFELAGIWLVLGLVYLIKKKGGDKN